jgi:hypothetical protein
VRTMCGLARCTHLLSVSAATHPGLLIWPLIVTVLKKCAFNYFFVFMTHLYKRYAPPCVPFAAGVTGSRRSRRGAGSCRGCFGRLVTCGASKAPCWNV